MLHETQLLAALDLTETAAKTRFSWRVNTPKLAHTVDL
ncbi:hypothetical protein AVDCRST_MAG92-3665 [uncultured Coleofasciculus sp.]|uniref:Uncharacterized protein n=1 Tax=uncultured Coleofasciculus sp. TaxID=1267456 RepID=A0A6J4JND3_9CYAN|nr:hypothetical protein AVDCRST_MAG92-3665 [uncultured Coleofasciculus sp.]